MKPIYVKELKEYSKDELTELFNINTDNETKSLIVKLIKYKIIKKVKNNLSEQNLSELLFDELESKESITEITSLHKTFYTFIFVGILVVGEEIILSFPKYVNENEMTIEKMKQIINVIKKTKFIEQKINSASGNFDNQIFNPLGLILNLLDSFRENGIYKNYHDIIEINGEGEILWDQTINDTFAILSNNIPFYTELKTIKTEENINDYFRWLHEFILTICSERLKNAGLLSLFDMKEISLYEGDVSDFGDKDYILFKLEKEINVQFISWKKDVLKTLYTYIAEDKVEEQGFGISMYGTNNFKWIWEKVCSEVIGNQLNTALQELPLSIKGRYLKNKNKKLKEIIENPKWIPYKNNKDMKISHDSDKTLIPDIVNLISIDNRIFFGIYDAKYYNIYLDDKKLSNYPGVSDVTKQYLYQLAYSDFIKVNEIKEVQNVFLFPSDEETEITVFGEVTVPFLLEINNGELKDIQLVKLPAKLLFKLYLNDEKFNCFGEQINDLVRKSK